MVTPPVITDRWGVALNVNMLLALARLHLVEVYVLFFAQITSYSHRILGHSTQNKLLIWAILGSMNFTKNSNEARAEKKIKE